MLTACGRSRVAAVCANLQQASGLVGTGMVADQAGASINAAIDLLERPPRIASALDLAATLRADLQGGRESAAVNAGLAWCQRNG